MAFTDDFNRSDEDLETSANWTLQTGSAGSLEVASNVVANTTTADSCYLCPDQGSANNYTQADAGNTTSTRLYFIVATRVTDNNNFIGARVGATNGGVQCFSREGGSFVAQGSYSYTPSNGDTIRLEVDGNDITVYVNGVSRITDSSTFNNTVTRQGIIGRTPIEVNMLDNFEAGALGGGGGATIPVLYHHYRMMSA